MPLQYVQPTRPGFVAKIPPAAAQAPSSNTAAVATLAASTTGQGWTVSAVHWSYSGAPTGGSLTIAWTDPVKGSVSEVYAIIAGGPGSLIGNMAFPENVQVTFTLAAGGSGVSGTVYVEAVAE